MTTALVQTMLIQALDKSAMVKCITIGWAWYTHVCTVRAPVFGAGTSYFGTSEHYGITHGSLLTSWMNYE